MNNKQKFQNFLESIKNGKYDTLIESVKKGFNICFEAEESNAGYDFYVKLEEHIAMLQRNLKELLNTCAWIAETMDECVELAKKVYKEGDDYYGEDFIAQTFPKTIKVNGNVIETDDLEGYNVDNMQFILNELKRIYDEHLVNLKSEMEELKENQVNQVDEVEYRDDMDEENYVDDTIM